MCGLVGVAGNIGAAEEKIFKTLLFLDTLRGDHSTGILSVNKLKETLLFKKAVPATEISQYKQFDDIFKRISTVLIGHNRYATKGKINSTNAHPFQCGDIIGAHNGTLIGQYLLPDHKEFDVDSENIFHAINKEGVEATCKKLHGAFALTWYDRKDHTINLLRNDERPLYVAVTPDSKTIFWASEDWMIKVACGRAGYKFNPPLELDTHTHYKYKLPSVVKDNVVENLTAMPIAKLEGYEPPYYARSSSKQPFKNSVTPFNRGKETASLSCKDFLNKEIKFIVDGEAHKASGESYFLAHPVGYQDIELRIYTTRNSMLYFEMKDVEKTYTTHTGWARCLKYDTSGQYLIMDLGSIKSGHLQPPSDDVIEDMEDDCYEETYTGPNGTELSRSQFMAAVKDGCAWCTDLIVPSDSQELVWLSDGSCICPDCKGLVDVKQYLAL